MFRSVLPVTARATVPPGAGGEGRRAPVEESIKTSPVAPAPPAMTKLPPIE